MAQDLPEQGHRRRWPSVLGITIVGAIFALLVVALLVPDEFGSGPLPPELVARRDALRILNVAFLYQHREGRWPSTSQLGNRAPDGDPYFAPLPRDPWGRDFVIRVLAQDECEVRSNGPDGKPDTVDDIVIGSR